VGDFAARHLDTQPVHRVFECLTIFPALDGIDLDADHPYSVLL
jgi:hypothetical protein